MTTEDDFQRQLDEHPDDFQTRLVFADWLQDRDDPRAEGYRALGVNEMHPMLLSHRWLYLPAQLRAAGAQWMPHDWCHYLTVADGDHHPSRRAAEDAAALAFAKLPEQRRAELLSTSFCASTAEGDRR